MAEAAIEVCDGIPSYVEAHLDEFLDVGYSAWSSRGVAIPAMTPGLEAKRVRSG